MQKTKDYNNGLIYTEIDRCIDCNKCIRGCPILKSNVSVSDSLGHYSMCVDDTECIICGTCIDTCVHRARHYKDDCSHFLSALEQKENFSVIVAPSFFLNYPNEYKRVFGFLKSLGVKEFYSVSLGADITTWGYLNYLSGEKAVGNVAQPCPAVVRHIEKHQPELLPSLIPIQSPLMCTAIYLKKYEGINENFAFLSPCIAKKTEIESKRGLGLISYNVTFKNLMEHIRAQSIILEDFPEIDTDTAGLGSLYPAPGGLKENIDFYLGSKASVMHVEGEHHAYEFLKHLADYGGDLPETVPVLIDILNCGRGCSYGTGSEFRKGTNYNAAYQATAVRNKNYGKILENSSNMQINHKTRLAQLNERFSMLRLEDFLCEYEKDTTVSLVPIDESEIEAILNEKLFKLTANDKHVDCSACGYKTCREMAEAIALGINHHDNCVYFVKNALIESTHTMEQRLKAMLDASPILCAIFDDKFNITEVNQEAANILKLYDKQEYIDRFFELSPKYQPDGTPSRIKAPLAVRRALQTGMVYLPEWIHVTYDGEVVPVEVYLKRVILTGNQVVVAYARDLRKEKEMLSRLEASIDREQAANNAKTKFLSNMSHEIRTPMNSVLGIAELQLQKGTHSPETEEAFARIRNSSNLLLAIINDILDMSKVEAGKMEIIPVTYDTASLIIDTVQLNLMHIGSKKIEFRLNVDENLPESLLGDDLRVKQVLNNILSNAFKYTMEGFVCLSFAVQSSPDPEEIALLVTVRDSGQGLTKAQIDSLFGDEFTRFNLKSNRAIEGSGLGLIIAHQLVQMMHGEILVESEPGMGSTFTIRMIQRKTTDAVLGIEIAQGLQNLEDTQKALKKISKINREPMPYGRVLVVDDVESNLYVAKGFLLPYKLTVETAGSGAQAIEKLKKGEIYDIIFMDHMMPDMDGIETTKIIRKMGYNHPIVALTANALNDSKQLFLRNDFSDFISKPIDIENMDRCLMKFIRDKQTPEVIEKARATSTYFQPEIDESTLTEMMIDSFLRDAKNSENILDELYRLDKLDADALKRYIIQTHAMKSALLNIGKTELSKTASTLETAGRASDIEIILNETPRFLELLRGIINELENKQDVDLSAEDEDPVFLREQMLIIKQSCENYDMETADQALESIIHREYSKQTKELISTVADHLLCGELEKAAELIGKVMGE